MHVVVSMMHRKSRSCAYALAVCLLSGGCSREGSTQPPVDAPAAASVGFDGDFELVNGAGIAVCDAYLGDINRIGRSPLALSSRSRAGARQPPLFEPELASKTYLTAAEKEQEELPLLNKIAVFLWQRDANPAAHVPRTEVPAWRGTPEQLSAAAQNFYHAFEIDIQGFGYRIYRVDIDNDGSTENVFFRVSQLGSILVVLNEDLTDLDYEKTERILKHPSRRASGWPETRPAWPEDRAIGQDIVAVSDAVRGTAYSVFRYEDETFVDLWWEMHPEYPLQQTWSCGLLHVYKNAGEQSAEICTVRVRPELVEACEQQ